MALWIGELHLRIMIHVSIIAEFPEDETGPHLIFEERLVLPVWFAASREEAHARILRLLVTEPDFELPLHGAEGEVPFVSDTVRQVAVWDG